jgi:hypothetical protein
MATKEIITAALDYYQKWGWNIIPLYKDSKKPALESGEFVKIFDEKLPIEDLIKRLQTDQVGNIGLSIGHTSNLWVLDFDDPNKVEKYAEFISPLRQKTPSGGEHWFYLPVDKEIGNGVIESGVEFYSQHHNIVLSPSYVKAERGGRKYEGQYQWIEFGKPTTFPLSIWGSFKETSDYSLSKYSREEILDLLKYTAENLQFPSGQHNDTLFYGSMILLGDGTPYDVVLNMMLGWDRNDPSPQGDYVVKNAVQRANELAEKKEQPINVIFENDKKEVVKANIAPITRSLVSKRETFSQRHTRIGDYIPSWLIDTWILKEAITVMVAPPQRYKTWLAADMAWSICTGNKLLGEFKVNECGNVLVIQQEDPIKDLDWRYDLVDKSYYNRQPTEVTEKNGELIVKAQRCLDYEPIFVNDFVLDFNNDSSILELEAHIKETNSIMVIIDPLYSLGDADKFFSEMGRKISAKLKPIRERLGTTFLLVHHTKKNQNGGPDSLDRSQMWGSNLLLASFESTIMMGQLNPKVPTEITLNRYLKNKDKQDLITLNWKINDKLENPYERYQVEIVETKESDKKTMLLTTYLTQNGPTKLEVLHEEFKDIFGAKNNLSNFLDVHKDLFVKEKYGVWKTAPDGNK